MKWAFCAQVKWFAWQPQQGLLVVVEMISSPPARVSLSPSQLPALLPPRLPSAGRNLNDSPGLSAPVGLPEVTLLWPAPPHPAHS